MHTVRIGGVVLSGMAALAAQSFTYPDFANPTQLRVLGNATTTAGALRLVPNAPLQSGWAWRQTQLAITYGFATTFTFRLVPSAFGTRGKVFKLVPQ